MTKDEYDSEPVYFCKRCLSLNIQKLPAMPKQYYCAECGNVELESADIETWKNLYKARYGKDYVKKRELRWPYWC